MKGKITHIDFNESVLKPAKDEPIGAERSDSSGIVWKKVALNAWISQDNLYDYGAYNDFQVDYFPGGATYSNQRIYDYKTQVQRSLFMDDTLYTISLSMIKANDLDDLKEISKLDLEYKEQYYSGPMVY